MLTETKTPRTSWSRLAVFAALGVATGAFASWYIYKTVWSWPLPLLVAAWVGGAFVGRRSNSG